MLKKINVFIFAAGLLLASPCFAQKGGLHLGIKAGVNGNKIDGVAFKDGFTYSYLLGGLLQVPLSGKLGLQPEVLFVQSKTTASDDVSQPFDANDPANKHVKLDYLTIPILLSYGNNLKLQLGPQYSIAINKDNSLIQNGKEAFKSGDFSMAGGFQWKLPVLGLHVGGRYVVGLSELNDVSSGDKWKSQSIQVSTGFIF
ncbi:porin family protein [Hufsiella ginkgonis]|uniref:Outer membrane beta-barrel protein n=1 Tax=Hufsiella ginkgonis TaxID=2695274 RepID=A0A7K1XVW7_9SPHI|nr:porin family protein [Hufsiella ginkgonis]MXV14666.1 outer membrane beta-barrel protein [Hufsiella ginkgonis]